ncbi:branched-chain amino acid ABC transporter permease [Nocardioides sp. MJB4]|uniref:Branched-chain amino acid ABC transporter permease n=2 Tax=Nocardioides donggukensis TaxID=2774019 RepID=A0A927K622_9ACTN|nr:branched-chain amino acid ABC transporter permease [Nocardioides donggukensis]
MLASPSLAATEEEQSNTVQGTLVNTAEDRAPVEGVEITVTSPDGEVFTDTSDDEGKFEIEVPGRGGRVMIELDTETLPDGVSLRNENKSSITRNLNPGQRAVILFPIGPDTRDIATKWDRIPQLVVNGLIFGIILALGALGLSMVFGTTGLTNFAHGELLTLGAMAAYMFNVAMGLPFVLAAVLSVVVGLAVGWAQDRGLWRPLRHRGTGLIAMMIVTIGLQFLLRNLFQYFTSGRTLNYDAYVTPSGVDVGLFSYTYRDAIMAGISAAVIIAVTLALSFTRFGRATRAVADNPALAASTGINVDRVVSGVWIVGTGLAALAGVFLGYTLGVTFNIGQFTLLLLFASVTVGGLGSVWGALIGSLIIGVLIEVSTLVIPAELKNAGALMLLIVILLVRPQGLLGRKERIG